jgi:hypothetical protein
MTTKDPKCGLSPEARTASRAHIVAVQDVRIARSVENLVNDADALVERLIDESVRAIDTSVLRARHAAWKDALADLVKFTDSTPGSPSSIDYDFAKAQELSAEARFAYGVYIRERYHVQRQAEAIRAIRVIPGSMSVGAAEYAAEATKADFALAKKAYPRTNVNA